MVLINWQIIGTSDAEVTNRIWWKIVMFFAFCCAHLPDVILHPFKTSVDANSGCPAQEGSNLNQAHTWCPACKLETRVSNTAHRGNQVFYASRGHNLPGVCVRGWWWLGSMGPQFWGLYFVVCYLFFLVISFIFCCLSPAQFMRFP